MGDRSLETYESFFSHETFAAKAMDQVVAIYRSRTHDERTFMGQWEQTIEAAKRRGDR